MGIHFSKLPAHNFSYFFDEPRIINSASRIILFKTGGVSASVILLKNASAVSRPISVLCCSTVVMDGDTNEVKGSLPKPTIAISSGTLIVFSFKYSKAPKAA